MDKAQLQQALVVRLNPDFKIHPTTRGVHF